MCISHGRCCCLTTSHKAFAALRCPPPASKNTSSSVFIPTDSHMNGHPGPYNRGMIRLITVGDRKIMHRINQWPAPGWIRKWMLTASRAGDGWLWGAVGLILLLFGGDRRFAALSTGFLSVGAALLMFFVLKRIIGRE